MTASRNPSSTMVEAAALAAACAASEGSGAGRRFSLSGGSGPCRKAILSTHRQPRWAFTPGQDHRGAVLRLERKSALDPEHQRRGTCRSVRIAFGGSRRPLQLDRPGVPGERFADNLRPVGDQACFAQAPRSQRLGDQAGGEFSQRLGAAPARASSSRPRGK